MVSKTNEAALEEAIEKCLTGTSRETLIEHDLWGQAGDKLVSELLPLDLTSHAFEMGIPSDFNAQYAIDERYFWLFLEATQTIELDKLRRNGATDWKRKILERFDRLIKKHGIIHLLKKGLAVDDAFFVLMYPAPLASSSQSVHDDFTANIFSETRQVRYSLANPLQEIDMALFLNGIPLATIELKNAWTGQNARYHGQKQYREDRDTTQPLLNFARCLVHLAVDTDEVYMTTKLAGAGTFFLPFNKGNKHGKGNPPNPDGHKSAYLWQEVFTKDSLANIIQHFVRLDGAAKDPLNKRTLFFPRYHQLDVVRKLIADASTNGVGQTYLIQHSAGSGKSNSITWAAYQLIETYPASANTPGAKGLDQPLFDSVIVVTDRRLLDKQLRDNIKDFSEVKNIVAPAHKSSDLKAALESGKKIIITTIQKFPFIVDGIDDLTDRRFAVIIDEAHSSQGGSAQRFNDDLELENDAKIDFKIKAKQFVKIYGQMASIMPFEVVEWEKLYWFLKFLIPKLKIEDPSQVALDELLESVDLSSYGLERVKLNDAIILDAAKSEVDPQNPNPRGAHDTEDEIDPLDEIINSFNERWFQGWSATPEEQRVKFINIAESIKAHPDFATKYENNGDRYTRELTFEKMLKEVMLSRRKDELELYKLFANDTAFKASWQQSLERMVNQPNTPSA